MNSLSTEFRLAIFLMSGVVLGVIACFTLLSSFIRKREKKRLSVLQDRFIALGSHYLLTPISGIQAAISRLQEVETMDLEGRRKLYEAILQGQSRLSIIAQQLILVNQLQTDGMKLDLSPTSLSTVLLDAAWAIEPLARQKSVKVSVIDTTGGNSQVRADGRRLKIALIAVIDNAVKFSQEGGEVKVALGIGEGICQLVIADAGIGMPAGVIEHVMEKFYRGTSLYEFDYEGLGLGLYVTKRIIDLHGGSINVQSAPKAGTRVTIEFPKQ